jgi:molybdenum cofactor cytidylyltransferase
VCWKLSFPVLSLGLNYGLDGSFIFTASKDEFKMRLAQALRLVCEGESRPAAVPRLALVGAGGKSTALFQLARQLPPPVLLTSTTHLAEEQLRMADRHLYVDGPEDLADLERALPTGVTLLTGRGDEIRRTGGLPGPALQRLLELADERQVPLLLEADGARMLPLKAPAGHEPAIPAFANMVVVVVGLSVLGKPISPEWVHRPERFQELSGASQDSEITLDLVERILLHPAGGLKNIPGGARRVVLLNQADTPELMERGRLLADRLLPAYHAALVASLKPGGSTPGEPGVHRAYEPVAGIVLAAGESRRYGTPKQLLSWQGESFVRRVAQTALNSGLSPVVVVSGAYTPQIRQVLGNLPVVLVHNPDWTEGQSSSVQAGLRALPSEIGAALFLLADQPQVPENLIRSLVDLHAGNLIPIVAPQVAGRRANPVLFDRITFSDLMELTGDVGGRPLFSKHPAAWLAWDDPELLLDVDTPEDYRKLLRKLS